MKRLPFIFIFLLIVLFMFVLAASTPSIAAQDSTQEATVEAQPVTIVGEGATLTFDTGGAPTEPEEPMPWPARVGMILTVAGTAAYTVLQGIREFVRALRDLVYGIAHHPIVITLLERAFNNAPESTQNAVKTESGAFLDEVRGLIDELRKLRDEATDKTPYVVKIEAGQSPTSTPTSNLQDGM